MIRSLHTTYRLSRSRTARWLLSPATTTQESPRIATEEYGPTTGRRLTFPSRGLSVMVTQTKVQDMPKEDTQMASLTEQDEIPTFDDIIITPSCWQRILALQSKKNDPSVYFLRLYVDAGGCSGFSYKFEIDDALEEDEDKIYNGPQGARVVIDQASLELVKGSTIDFVQEMIKSSFEVKDNPLSESACGCGSSFALKNFAANPALD